jgi:hypothetical protein
LGHSRSCAAPDDDTNASFRTKSQSFLHGARNCSEWPDELLRVSHATEEAGIGRIRPTLERASRKQSATRGAPQSMPV